MGESMESASVQHLAYLAVLANVAPLGNPSDLEAKLRVDTKALVDR